VANLQDLRSAHPFSNLWVTGHSLGGSMATLCALDLFRQGFTVDKFITFEQPRVGNEEFGIYFDSIFPQALRYTHYKDMVVHLPPKWTGYHHIATEVYLTTETGSNYIYCNGSGEDAKCSD